MGVTIPVAPRERQTGVPAAGNSATNGQFRISQGNADTRSHVQAAFCTPILATCILIGQSLDIAG